jgi:hypothetical protein
MSAAAASYLVSLTELETAASSTKPSSAISALIGKSGFIEVRRKRLGHIDAPRGIGGLRYRF